MMLPAWKSGCPEGDLDARGIERMPRGRPGCPQKSGCPEGDLDARVIERMPRGRPGCRAVHDVSRLFPGCSWMLFPAEERMPRDAMLFPDRSWMPAEERMPQNVRGCFP